MNQYFKGVVWPRESEDVQVKSGKRTTVTRRVYRYVVVGMVVTDEPIEKFEGKNEIVLDGPVDGMVEPLLSIKSRKPEYILGDANSVLEGLNDI